MKDETIRIILRKWCQPIQRLYIWYDITCTFWKTWRYDEQYYKQYWIGIHNQRGWKAKVREELEYEDNDDNNINDKNTDKYDNTSDTNAKKNNNM